MKTISNRYASIRLGENLTKKDFANSLGIHPVVSGDIELGKREPSRDVLVRLAKIYNVDINWLLTGKPSTFTEDKSKEFEEFAFIDFYEQEVAAGVGVEIDNYIEKKQIPIPSSIIHPFNSNKVKALEVRGDSMTGIGLYDKDLVFFVPEKNEGEGIYVISIGSKLLVKRIQVDHVKRSVNIISENPKYPIQRLLEDEIESFKIEGKVIAWIHRC